MSSENILSHFLIIKIAKEQRQPEEEGDEDTIGESSQKLLAKGRFPSSLSAEDTLPDSQDSAWGGVLPAQSPE